MSERWQTAEGPAVVAERDQFEADLRDRIGDAAMLFCVTMDADCELAVRCLFGLDDELGAEDRVEATAMFLFRARQAIDELMGELEEVL